MLKRSVNLKLLLKLPVFLLGICLAAAPALAVTIEVADSSGLVGETVLVPVSISDVAGDIWSAELNFSWYANHATLTGVETVGTLTQDWVVNFLGGSGSGNVSAAGAAPLAGDGVLVYLEFLLGPNTGTTYLNFNSAVLNEGDPVPELLNGQISIGPLPAVNIYPDSGLLVVGDDLEFSTSSGSEPYTYTSSDPAVAYFMTDTSILHAQSPGSVQAFTEDASGTTDATTGVIEVRPFRLQALAVSGTQGQTVLVPLLINNPAGYGIVSAEISASWYASTATFTGVVTTGTLLEAAGWATPAVSSTTNSVFLASAGSTSLPSVGVLLYLEFTVNSSFNLSIDPGLFNETYQALPVNGYVTVTPLPTLTLSPATANMLVGDDLQLVLSGTPTLPLIYHWSDPSVLSVSADGLITAHEPTWSEIWVTDSLGAESNHLVINVYDFALPALGVSVAADETVMIPIKVERELDDLDIFSFELGVSFSSYYVEFLGAVSAGSATEDWGAPLAVDEGGLVMVYHAGATSLAGCPTGLIYLEFRGLPTIGYTYSGFSLNRALFNEGDPRVLINYGDPCIVSAVPQAPGAGLTMLPNHPNPFNPGTMIRFEVGEQGGIGNLAIYSARGELVRQLVSGPMSSGSHHEVFWDGRDDSGRLQSSGVYFSRLEVAGSRVIGKMVLIK